MGRKGVLKTLLEKEEFLLSTTQTALVDIVDQDQTAQAMLSDL